MPDAREPSEIVSGSDFEHVARQVVARTLRRPATDAVVREEGVSLAYTLAEAAHARIEELQAVYGEAPDA